MANAYIPYGVYWSTPFAKWQGSIAHLNSVKLAANCAKRMFDERKVDGALIDLGILGITNPQHGTFYGLDRKSTCLNSSHHSISYAVFCLKKKKKSHTRNRTDSPNKHEKKSGQRHNTK